MGSIQNLKDKAKACLVKKSDIPMSPLFNMANVAKRDKTSDLKILQDAIDYLTCKAKAKLVFNSEEKEFLKELYEAFWWGGMYKGYKEAAQLANHYVNGEGNGKSNPLRINAEVYKSSKIVIATMAAMKKYIVEQFKNQKSIHSITSNNVDFRSKKYAKPLLHMNYRTEGKMKPSGVLEAAQNNHRLHKTDGHFHLQALSSAKPKQGFKTTWRVDSYYDFEPFEKHDYFTVIPLGKEKLILPDGLSEYMTKIGVAKAFWYRAEWIEAWSEA